MTRLVLLRHGQSPWNRDNLFTGWQDVDLTPEGMEEARRAGQFMREAGLTFDIAYTSMLKRAIRSLWLALEAMDCLWLPVVKCWRLNERHYGALEGLSKTEMRSAYGTSPEDALDERDATTIGVRKRSSNYFGAMCIRPMIAARKARSKRGGNAKRYAKVITSFATPFRATSAALVAVRPNMLE